MKQNFPVIALINAICLVSVLPAVSQVFVKSWDHTIGGDKNDMVSIVRPVPGTGYLIGGTSFSGISADKTEGNHDSSLATSDFWLVLTDFSGNKIWDRRFGGPGSEIHFESIVVADGFISGGHTFSPAGNDITEDNRDTSQNSNDYWIVKTGFNGQKIWDKRFGGTLFENFGSLRATPDGGLIIAGSSFSDIGGDKTESSRGSWDIWLVRTDSLGNKLWDRRFGGTDDDFATSVEVALDGSMIVGGYSKSQTGGDKTEPCRGSQDYWVIKVDDLGNLVWDKTFGGSDNDWLFSISLTADGNILIGGQSYSPVSGEKSEPNHDPAPSGSDRWVVKINDAGLKIWDRTYGADEVEDLSQVIALQDGGFITTGESYSEANGDKTEPNLGIEQTWILKADSLGNVEWDKTIFTLGHDESGFLITDGPDCFVTVNFCTADTGGYKTEDSKGYGDYFFIRMCMDTTLAINEPFDVAEWSIWPNPTAYSIMVKVPENEMLQQIDIVDITGRICLSLTEQFSNGRNPEIKLDILPSGWFFARMRTDHGIVTLPFIKN